MSKLVMLYFSNKRVGYLNSSLCSFKVAYVIVTPQPTILIAAPIIICISISVVVTQMQTLATTAIWFTYDWMISVRIVTCIHGFFL